MSDQLDLPVEFDDNEEDVVDVDQQPVRYSDVLLSATDWTTETIIAQLNRQTINLSPKFQRRDAWPKKRKSLFIESLLLGLPIPQIVLAESKEKRGGFLVLDGKQRLLTLMQFWGIASASPHNGFALSDLEARKDLARKTYADLESDPGLTDDWTYLTNQSIRTVVIRNWPDADFLHLVFLRLNTGTQKLSPQELRQAMYPGGFSDFLDDFSASSPELQSLLNLKGPDFRMRDVELVARYLAFANFLSGYNGNWKGLLDRTFERLNADWEDAKPGIEEQLQDFAAGVGALNKIFHGSVARRDGGRRANVFNRAIFDALIFYFRDERIRVAAVEHAEEVRKAYSTLLKDPDFLASVERATTRIQPIIQRLTLFGTALRDAADVDFAIPTESAPDSSTGQRIVFPGFWK